MPNIKSKTNVKFLFDDDHVLNKWSKKERKKILGRGHHDMQSNSHEIFKHSEFDQWLYIQRNGDQIKKLVCHFVADI